MPLGSPNSTLTKFDTVNLDHVPSSGIGIDGSTSGTTTIVSGASATATITLPSATDTLVGRDTTDTLTNKTLTAPVINGAVVGSIARCSTQQDATANTTLADIPGMVVTVVPGTYRFRCVVPGTANASGGIKLAFKLTTTVLTSIEATGLAFAAAAVAVQHTTTTTDQTSLVSSTSAAILSLIEGSAVIGTGGTIKLQMAQNASNGAASSVYVGAYMEFTRIA